MTGARALERRQMTAEEVLAVFVTRHRWQSEWDPEADSSAVLTFESTIAEWRDACDSSGTLPWREVPHRLCRIAGCASICLFLLGWLPLYVGQWKEWPDTACVGAWAIVIGCLGLFAAALPPPKAVVIEGVETFGDLARVLSRTTVTTGRGGSVDL